MIILTTTRSLEVVLDGAPSVELPWTASYVDLALPALPVPDGVDGVTAGTTPVTLIASPATGKRQVKALAITNIASAARVITVMVNNGASTFPAYPPVTLQPGDGLLYIDTRGFYVVDSTGSERMGIIGATGLKGDKGDTGLTGPLGPVGPANWNQGTATINFGAFPGTSEASVTVAGLIGLAYGAMAFWGADTSADHSAADHEYAAALIGLSVSAIIPGVGFTIFARGLDKLQGAFTVRYVWA